MKRRPLLELLRAQYPERPVQELYAAVICGEIRVNEQTVRDPKRRFAEDAVIALDAPARYVSRGGEKLEQAIADLEFTVAGKVLLDAGSSTGGFTDCLLRHGARVVHAVDVGYNQLDYRLRRDSRVIVHERTNLRVVRELSPPADRAVADLSFRSLRGITGHVIDLTGEKLALVLCKPQFEHAFRGSPKPAFDGVVRGAVETAAIVAETITALERERVLLLGAAPSVLRGRHGNQEVFLLVTRAGAETAEAAMDAAYIERREALIGEIAAELARRD